MPSREAILLLAFLLLVITMSNCSGQKNHISTPLDFDLQVVSATVQQWAGGPAPIGGAHHVVTVVKPAGVALEITSIWLGDREKGRAPAAEVIMSGAVFVDPTVGADVEQFGIRFSTSQPVAPAQNPTPESVPDDLPAEFVSGAVIWYTSGAGPARHLIVEEFERLEPLLYP